MSYTADEVEGIMISSYSGSKAKKIHLDLNVTGLFKIFVGLYPESQAGFSSPVNSGIQLKLKGDPVFSELWCPTGQGNFLYETYWRMAKLNSQRIEIAPLQRTYGDPRSALAYIKLVPAIPEKPRVNLLEMAAFDDAFSFFFFNSCTSKKDIQKIFKPLRDTPFTRIYWNIGAGDLTTYPTKIGNSMYDSNNVFRRQGENNYRRFIGKMKAKNIDLLKIACECAKKCGLEFHAYHRPAFVTGTPPFEDIGESTFFKKHPEFRCLDLDGAIVTRLSYAFNQVQQHVLSLYDEVLGYGVDGLNLAFIRGIPMHLYEEPILDGFFKLHGKKITDKNVLSRDVFNYKAAITTGFLKRVKNLVIKRKKEGKLSVIVFPNEEINRKYFLDVEKWIKEEIIDLVMSHPYCKGISGPHNHDYNYYASIVKGTDCKYFPLIQDVVDNKDSGEHYLQLSEKCFKAGVDGLAFWDTYSRVIRPEQRAVIQALADPVTAKEKIAKINRENHCFPLRTVAGFRVDKYPVSWAF